MDNAAVWIFFVGMVGAAAWSVVLAVQVSRYKRMVASWQRAKKYVGGLEVEVSGRETGTR